MSCCGSRRQQFFAPPRPLVNGSTPPSAPAAVSGVAQQPALFFVYQGQTALTVMGRATGRRYRFSEPGARVAIDPRDAPGLRGIPLLRRA